MKTGYIILVRNPFQWRFFFSSIIWWLIRVVARSRYNHVAMFWESEGVPLVVEADGRGVSVNHYNVWLHRAKREVRIIPVECQAANFVQHLGKKYDYTSLLVYCLIKAIRKAWYGHSPDFSQEKFYCFELVAHAHGLPNANQIMPREFLTYFEKQ